MRWLLFDDYERYKSLIYLLSHVNLCYIKIQNKRYLTENRISIFEINWFTKGNRTEYIVLFLYIVSFLRKTSHQKID